MFSSCVCQCYRSVLANEKQRKFPDDPVWTNEKAPLYGVMSAVQRDRPKARTEKWWEKDMMEE